RGRASARGVPGPAGRATRAGPHADPAIAAAKMAEASAAKRRKALFFLAELLAGGLDLVFDLRAGHRFAVAVERALPRLDGLLMVAALEQQIAEMTLDHGHGRKLFAGFPQRRLRGVELALLEVGPAETVEVCRVSGVQHERALHERDRLVEALTALGQHVAE